MIIPFEERSIKELIGWLELDNIADEFTEQELTAVASQVKEDFDVDWDSMAEWRDQVEYCLELLEPATEPRSDPWEGASNFKTPAVSNAVISFGDRASAQLLRPKDLVKGEVVGQDKDDSKAKRANRVSTYMSYQFNHEMKTWRADEQSVLYRIPVQDCMFKKLFFDPIEQRMESDIIQYPFFAINQSTRSMEEMTSFTHIVPMTANEVISNQRANIWSDSDLKLDGEDLMDMSEDPDKATDNKNHSPLNTFYEHQCYLDCDGDGYQEPWTVWLHVQSGTVVRMLPRFNLKGVTVSNGNDTFNADEIYGPLFDEFGPIFNEDGTEPVVGFGIPQIITGQDGTVKRTILMKTSDTFEVVRIRPINNLTKRGFLPSPRGDFLSVGYGYLMSTLAQAVNTGTNLLFDAGVLHNLQGGYLAKGMRKKLGDDKFKPGEWKETNVEGAILQNGIWPLPTKEPSQVLMALVDKFEMQIEKIAANVDMGNVIGPNTAATTALAMFEEMNTAVTALMKNQVAGQSHEFQRLYELNSIYLDEDTYLEVIDEEANWEEDFNQSDLNLFPTANPEMSNRTQTLMQAQLQMENLPQIIEVGGDGQEVVRRYLEALGEDNVEAIIPEPTEDFLAQQQATAASAHSGSTKASSVVDPGGACNSTKRSTAKSLARSSAIQSPCVRWNSVSPGQSGQFVLCMPKYGRRSSRPTGPSDSYSVEQSSQRGELVRKTSWLPVFRSRAASGTHR